MSVTPAMVIPQRGILCGAEGELILVRVSIAPRRLEDVLECLAQVSFPINPQIIHGLPTVVEFPAYESRVAEVREALAHDGIPADAVTVVRMIEQIA